MKTSFVIRRTMVSFLIVFFSLEAFAQTGFEEWKKQRQQQMQDFKEEREKQLEQLSKQFDDYIKEQDKAFAGYLAERWKQFQVFKGVEPPDEPKPDIFPSYEEPERPIPPKPLPTIKVPPLITPKFVPDPILPRVMKSEPQEFAVTIAEINFYGVLLPFEYDLNLASRLSGEINEEAISKQFELLSATNYNTLLDQFYDYREQMNLNDWGYYMFVRKAADQIAGNDSNSARFLTWFLLIRSGYLTKVAFYENEIFVLLPVINQVYSRNYFTFNNLNYYMMEGDQNNLFTYENDFPEAHRLFDLNVNSVLAIGDQSSAYQFRFTFEGNETPINVNFNSHAIDFYKDYPQSDIKVYFDAMVSNELKTSLVENFAPLIQGKSELEAVSILLRFVQTAFDYKTDQDQFGFEKFFFADELFHYPYSDCEDRSVLFAYLVRSLIGLDVVGLQFPGHIATAVGFTEAVNGDYLIFEGKKFVMADPTYINAPVGLTMPDYVEIEAEIVPLGNKFGNAKYERELWEEVLAGGGNRGDNQSDLIVGKDGNILITGYFDEYFRFGAINQTADGNAAMFSMLLNSDREPVWFNRSTGNGKAVAYSANFDEQGNALVTGTFSGAITLGKQSIQTGGEVDIFLAKFDRSGHPVWISKAGFDTIHQDNFLNFVAKFSADGHHLGNDLYFDSKDFNQFGIKTGSGGDIFITGAFNRNTGMNLKEAGFASGGEFSVIEMLKEENDKLVQQKYEKTIAGLFAAVHLIRTSDVSIPGKDVQILFDKYNPSFKKEFPNIYNTIGSIVFLKNKDGIVTIKTSNSKGLNIDMMRVDNEAKIKIVMLSSGDARLEVLSGVRVGKAIFWYNLNYVVMYRQNGNMLFDYDTDNAQQVRNLKNDILY
ncbi:MAG: hypothetical protein IH598_07440 [Bacteroidales bacterium]|nr:hypothetical protein [Bacteroidales bacterium]